jgi:parallel beta-helix repeat protein
MRGISVTEMSMGSVTDNEVRDARGIGIWCNDRSMCDIRKNTVIDTTGTGFGVLASFQSEADLRQNQLSANPRPVEVLTSALVRYR